MNILKVQLYTSNLKETQNFYSKVLGFELKDINRAYFSFIVGQIEIKFNYRQADKKSNYILGITLNDFSQLIANFNSYKINFKEHSNYLFVKDNQENVILFLNYSNENHLSFICNTQDSLNNIDLKIPTITKLDTSNLNEFNFILNDTFQFDDLNLEIIRSPMSLLYEESGSKIQLIIPGNQKKAIISIINQ